MLASLDPPAICFGLCPDPSTGLYHPYNNPSILPENSLSAFQHWCSAYNTPVQDPACIGIDALLTRQEIPHRTPTMLSLSPEDLQSMAEPFAETRGGLILNTASHLHEANTRRALLDAVTGKVAQR